MGMASFLPRVASWQKKPQKLLQLTQGDYTEDDYSGALFLRNQVTGPGAWFQRVVLSLLINTWCVLAIKRNKLSVSSLSILFKSQADR